jgi:hypothetical protein
LSLTRARFPGAQPAEGIRRAHRLTAISVALAAGLIASACSGGASGNAGGANATLLTPHPKSVSVTLDTSKATTKLIPVTGGTLKATGADGSVYTLTIPDKALGGDEMVTMTPLSAVNGLPFSGGLVAGVQLEPDGLELFQMATLTIKPAKNVPIADQVAVSYHGSGDNLHMLPLDPTSGISMHILHFSGYSVAAGIKGEIDEQAKHPPTDAADQAVQQINADAAAAIAAERQAALDGKPPTNDVLNILKGTLDRWFNQVVEPNVAAAQADYTLTYAALQIALAWQRQVELLGAEDGHKAQIDRLTGQRQALRTAYEKAVADRCLSKHDLSAVVELLSLEGEFEMYGTPPSAAAASPLDTLRKCLRFELDFETVEPFVTNEGETFILHDRVSKLVLEPALGSGNLSASQAHEILGVTSVCPCRRFEHPVSARPFTVSNLSFHMHFMLRRDSKTPPITGVVLTIDTGEVTGVRYDATSNTQIGARTVQVPAYECPADETLNVMACWSERHRSERLNGSTTSFVIQMDFVGTGLFARKTYNLPCTEYLTDCNAPNEMTTFDLRHAPLG